ncbi:MAG: flagellin [Rhodospirillales bacterium]
MPAEVTLSSAARNSLLALRRTTSLIDLRQRRISSGLRVSNAVDDPVAFFKSRALSERAADFQRRKDAIDQGVSASQAALTAAEGIESLVDQLKDLATSLKSSTGDAFSGLLRQFNDIRTQINNLAADATYQGTNLINGPGQRLQVRFSDRADSFLTVQSVDLNNSALGIQEVTTEADTVFDVVYARADPLRNSNAAGIVDVNGITANFSFTYNGPDETFRVGGDYQIAYGDTFLALDVQQERRFVRGEVINIGVVSGAGGVGNLQTANGVESGIYAVVASALLGIDPGRGRKRIFKGVSAAEAPEISPANYIEEGGTDAINRVIDELDAGLSAVQVSVSSLKANVALLQTRLEFTEEYAKTLEGGAEKYTLADVDEETVQLTALKTRQRVTLSALALADGGESGILALLRQALSQNKGRQFSPLTVLENAAGS